MGKVRPASVMKRGGLGVRAYITAALIAAVIVLAAYALTVGRASGYRLSADPEDWSRFGSYVGGSLGAAYGLLAFIGVMLTLKEQRDKGAEQHKVAESTVYFQQAEIALRAAVRDFSEPTDSEGRPRNSRRHWLNFSRGVMNAQKLAEKIETDALQEAWKRTEHYWRERVYDLLDPIWESFPADYYGYEKPEDQIKNFAAAPGDRPSISEPSLVFVYRWIQWPADQPDTLDRATRFTEDEIVRMETFGPRGLARYIRIRRAGPPAARPRSLDDLKHTE